MKTFREIYRAINDYANNRKSEESGIPHNSDGMCLVKCNEQWHRAVYTKSSGDGKPLCSLIDLEIQQKIPVCNIIPIPKGLSDLPLMTELYKVEGIDASSSKVTKSLFTSIFVENATVQVDETVDDGGDFCLLRCGALKRF